MTTGNRRSGRQLHRLAPVGRRRGSVLNDGLLPPIAHPGGALPSGGDPVNRFGSGCSAYAADLNYDFSQGNGQIGGVPSGIGVYRSDARTLATCPRGTSPADLVHPEC
jgi:hypothetical protein